MKSWFQQDGQRIREVSNLLHIYQAMSTPPKKPEGLEIQRTDLPRDQWIAHVYDGLCHYCGKPANESEEKNLRHYAATLAENYYDDPTARVSPADAVWEELQAST